MYDIKTTFRAESVQDALRLLSENQGAVIVCGGTDVMIRLRELKLRWAIATVAELICFAVVWKKSVRPRLG